MTERIDRSETVRVLQAVALGAALGAILTILARSR
jgi:hypothetical protein